MSDENLPVITESEWNRQFGGGTDLPVITESEFNKLSQGYGASGSWDAPEPTVSAYDRTQGILKGIAKAGSDVVAAPADLLFRGGVGIVDAITGNETETKGAYPSDYRNRFLDWASGGAGDQTTEDVTQLAGNIGAVLFAPSQAKNIASKVPFLSKLGASDSMFAPLARLGSKAVGYGAEGAGYSALFNPKSENLGQEMASGAVTNIAIPSIFNTIGTATKGISKALPEIGRKLEQSAFGATKTRIRQAYERSPEIYDDLGNKQIKDNPIAKAIQAFRAEGGGKASMEGDALLKDLAGQTKRYVGELNAELSKASAKQTGAIIPGYQATEKYIQGLAGVEKKAARAMADDLMSATTAELDGSLLALQREKLALGDVIKDSAYGTNANPMKVNILKRIRADLRQAIEDGYQKVTGKSGENVKALNEQIGMRETLLPLFEDIRNSGEAMDPLKWLVQNWKTTGGFGGAALLAAGSVGAPAAAIPAIGGLAMTPTGRKVIGDAARNPQLGAGLDAVAKASNMFSVTGRVANAFAENGGDPVSAYQKPQDRRQPNTPPKLQELYSFSNSAPKPATTQAPIDAAFNQLNSQAKQEVSMSGDVDLDRIVDQLEPALVKYESTNNPKAESKENAYMKANKTGTAKGLWQLLDSTGKEWHKRLGLDGEYDPYNAEQNATIGRAYLKSLLNHYDGDYELALTAYHSGMGTVDKLLDRTGGSTLADIKDKLGPEGRKYAAQVLKRLPKPIAVKA